MKNESDCRSGDDKNNKQNGDGNDDVVESGEKQDMTAMRECEFCGKKFSSGKALGGHKRFHIQVQKKERESAKKPKTDSDGNSSININISINLSPLNSSNQENSLTCSLCNKDFPSQKSLFGHMRSHPDRDWRGVQPPIDNDLSEEDAAAATPPLPPRWGKTDTRGRESVEAAAAKTLVSMVNDKDGSSKNVEGELDGYKCNICNESFPTFQGLRRHRSSHNNNNKNNKDKNKREPEPGEANHSKVTLSFDLNELPNN